MENSFSSVVTEEMTEMILNCQERKPSKWEIYTQTNCHSQVKTFSHKQIKYDTHIPMKKLLSYIQAYLVLLLCTLLCFTDTASLCGFGGGFLYFFGFCFIHIESLWQPQIKQVCQHYFSSGICSRHVSMSHFGNSCWIPNIFIICGSDDQWSVLTGISTSLFPV